MESLLAHQDLVDIHSLVIGMGERRVAGTVVHRWYAERREPGHIGPALFRPRDPADRGHERLGGRVRQARPSTGGRVHEFDVEVPGAGIP